ncbi:MAG: MFS transporter [Chloroflexota bacterium]
MSSKLLSSVNDSAYARRWWIVGAILIGTFAGATGNSMMAVALPNIVSDYQVGLNLGVWVIAVYSLFVAVFMPIFGWLGDRFGYRRLYIGGLLCLAIFSWAAAVAPSFFWLIVFRVFQGIGSATLLPAIMGIISQIFPEQERGLALGFWSMVNGAAHGSGPIISGFLIQALSWSAIFWFLGSMGFIAAAAVFWLAPVDSKEGSRQFDLLGAMAFTLAILTLMFNLSQGSTIGWSSWLSIGLWIAFAGLTVLFFLTERRVAEPFVDLNIFRNQRYTAVTLIAGAQFFTLLGVPILVALYLIDFRGMPTGLAGLLIAPLAITSAVFSPIGGRLADRYGFQRLLAAGMGIVTLAAVALLFWGAETPNWMIALPLAIMGVGMGFTQSPSAAGITLIVPNEQRGVAMGIFHMLRFIFGTLSVTLFGLILEGAPLNGSGQNQAFLWSFILLISVAAVATLLAFIMAAKQIPSVKSPSKNA